MSIELANLDKLLSYAPIRKEVLWVESLNIGGGALHIVIEDGNKEDANIAWCIEQMQSGKWEGYASMVKPEDRPRFLALAKDLLGMPILYRELIISGTTVSEEVFDLIHNTDTTQ